MRPTIVAIVLTITVSLLAITATRAPALSEWWTPEGKSCPTFDSDEACRSYCQQDPQGRCGGATVCSFRTGDQRPMC